MKGIGLVLLIVVLIVGILYIQKGSKDTSEASETEEIKAPSSMQEKLEVPGRAKETLIESPIANIKSAIEAYFMNHNEYPQQLQDLIPNYIRTESALNDPWQKKFKLEREGEDNLFLVSAGRDGVFGTQDDIKRGI
jgi:hypothetical protein